MGAIVLTAYILTPFAIGTVIHNANLHVAPIPQSTWLADVGLAASPFLAGAPIVVPVLLLAIWLGRKARKC